MRNISRFKNSIRASSVYSLAFMLTFALAAGLTTYEEAAAQPSIKLTVDPTSIDEEDGVGTLVTVTATASAGFVDDAVIVLSIGGTATMQDGDDDMVYDYSTITGTQGTGDNADKFIITIHGGQDPVDLTGENPLTINLNDDGAFEENETIIISGSLSGSIVTPATITVVDDDYDITLTTDDPSISENAADPVSVVVTATLSSLRTSPVTVGLNFSGTASSSYYTAGGTHSITIGAGVLTSTATVTISPNDNDTRGGDKTVIIGGSSGNLHVKPAPAVTITDNEVAPSIKLAVNPSSITEDAGATNVRVTAEVDGKLLESATTVKLAVIAMDADNPTTTSSASSDDYTLGGTKSITIPASSKTGSTSLVFTPDDDAYYEGDESETVILMGTSEGLTVANTATISIVDNDFDLILSLDNDMVGEGADDPVKLTVTATLTGGRRTNDIEVPLQVGTATGYTFQINDTDADDDNITIKAGDLEGTATITVTPPATNDEVYSGNLTVDVTANDQDFDLNDKKATITLVDDEDKPTVALSVTPTTITEGGAGAVEVTATLSGEHSEDITVMLSFSGTAEAGVDKDYTVDEGQQIVITTGTSNSANVTFTLNDDGAFEHAETIVITGSASNDLSVDSPVTVTVEDDDFDVELSFADVTISEGVEDAQSVIVTATLQSARTTPLTIALNFSGTASRSEYVVGGTTTITVAPGDAEAVGTATVTIDPIDNDLRGGDKTIKIAGTAAGVNVKAATQTITIMDDEVAPTVTIKVSPDKLNEDAGTVRVTVTAEISGGDPLASAATIELTVDPADVADSGPADNPVTMANKNDFSVSGTKSITIRAGAKSGSTSLSITVKDDPLFESEEMIAVSSTTDAPVANDANGDGTTGDIADVTIAIVDNDFDIKMSVDTQSIAEDSADAVTVKVTATQTGRRTSDVTVTVAYSMGGSPVAEAVATGGTITIDAGEVSGEVKVSIDPESLNNDGYEGDRSIDVTGTATGLNIQNSTVTIADDEVKPTVTLAVEPSDVGEGGGGETVTVTATLTPNGLTAGTDIVLELGGTAVRNEESGTDAYDSRDYSAGATLDDLNVPANSLTGEATVTITPNDDDEFEATKTIIVSGKSSAVVSIASATINLVNDDFDVSISVDGGAVVNENAEDPESVEITAELEAAKTSPVTVQLTFGGTASSSDYAVGGTTTITLGAGVLTGTATVTFDPVDNSVRGGDKTITVSGMIPGSDLNVQGAANSISLVDDEEAPTVVVKVAPDMVNEDAGAVPVTVTAELTDGAPLADAATITLKVEPSDAGDVGGTTANKEDFSVTGTLEIVIPAGMESASTTLTFDITNDALHEMSETVSVMSSTTAPVEDAEIGVQIADAILTIVDNDFDIQLTVDPPSVAEDAADPVTVTVTATLRGTRTSNIDVAVAYSDIDGTSYSTDGEMITIEAGDMSGTTEVTITSTATLNNDGYEGDRSIDVTGTATGLNFQDTKITIADDEVKPTVTLAVEPSDVGEGGGGETVTVTATLTPNGLTAGTDIVLELGGTAVRNEESGTDAYDSRDYSAGATLDDLNVPANSLTGEATVTITPNDDDEFEATKTIIVSGKSSDVVSIASATINLVNEDFDVMMSIPADVDGADNPMTVAEDNADPVSIAIQASLTAARTSPVTVQLTFGGSADASKYVVGGTTTITLGAGVLSSTATVTIDPVDNELRGGDKMIEVSGTIAGSDLNVQMAEQTITLMDDEPEAELTLTANPSSISEGAGATGVILTGELNVGLESAATVALEIGDMAAGTTATGDGTDYSASELMSIMFPAASKSATSSFTVTPNDDNLHEDPDEIIVVSGSGDGLSDTAEITILGNDYDIRLSTDTVELAEGDKETDVVVTAEMVGGVRSSDVIVTLTLGGPTTRLTSNIDGGDNDELTIKSGTTTGTLTIKITPNADDNAFSGDKNIIISGTSSVEDQNVKSTSVLLRDAQRSMVTLTVDVEEIFEAGAMPTDVVVTVTMTEPLPSETVVTLAKSGTATKGEDYTVTGEGTITVDSGKTEGTTTLTITPDDDFRFEGDDGETIVISGSTDDNLRVKSANAIALIDNDAVPLVSVMVDPVSFAEGDEADSLTITVVLGGTSGEDVTLGLSKPGSAEIGVDFEVIVDESAGDFVIAAGDTMATKVVMIAPVDDEIYELDESFTVNVTASYGDPATDIDGMLMSEEITLVDNDLLPVITLAVAPPSVSEDGDGQVVTITATSDRESSMDIPVTLSKSGEAGLEGTESADPDVPGSVDYAISVAPDAGDLMVAAGERSGTKDITITPVNDDIYEGDETIEVNGTILDSEGAEVAVNSATLMLTDDEALPTLVALSVDTESVMEAGDSTAVTVTGTLSHRSSMPVSMPLSISETSTAMVDVDYTVSGLDDTMEFAALETETSASLTVTPVQDTIYERDETIVVEGQAGDDESAEKVAAMAITLVDDDPMPVVTLSVNPESVSEEGGTQPVEVTGTLSHESSMPIETALSLTGDDFTVGDLENIVVAAGDMSNSITFMITPNDDDVYEASPMITINGSVGEEGAEAVSAMLLLTEEESVPTVDLSINPMAVSESDGGHTDVTVTATASGKSALNVVVGLDISGDAKMGAEGDYTINDDAVMEIVIPALSTSGTTELQVTPNDDNIYERAENVMISAVVGDDAEVGTSAELTVNDNDEKPTVALSVMPDMIPEEGPDQDVTITATASHPSSMPITVTLAKEGTAAKGDDYTIGAGSASEIVIDPYETVMDASVMIQPVDDALYEQNEDIEVMGTVDVGGEAGEDAASTRITIVDNDPKPMVTLTTDVDSIEEMGGKVEVTVTAELSGLSSMPIDIALDKAGTAAKGEDYAPAGDPNITVEPGESTGSTVLVFEPVDDDIYENTETIVINGSFADKTAQPASIDLVDDETMPMINLVAMPGAVSEDLGAQDVTVMGTATGRSSMPITADLSFSGSAVEGMGGDFTVSGSSVMSITVEPLELEGSTVLSIIPVDDEVYENVEAIMIDGSYGTASAGSSAEVALMDDEVMPTIDLSADPGVITEEGGSQEVTITGTASGLASMPITVDISLDGMATNPGDYGVTDGEMALTVAPLELMGSTVLTIITVDDAVYENDEEIMVSGAVGGESAGASATLTLADNETMPTIKLSAGPGQVPSVTEGGGAQAVTVTATASGLSSMPVSVMLSLSDSMPGLATVDEDFAISGDMTITVEALATAGNTELTITPVDDDVFERDENIVIAGAYGDQMAESVSLTLVDNDMMPTVSMTIDNLSVMEEGGAQDVTLTMTASGRSSWPITRTVSISGTAGDPDDYAVSGELTVTVEAFDLEGSSTLTVTPVDDAIYEGDETIVISGSEDDVGEFTVTVVDNEPKPTFALSVDVDSITEEGGAQDVMVTATASGLSSMDLMVSLTKSGTAEKGVDYEPAGNPEIVVAAGELTGYTMLTFTTVDDAIYEQDESIVIGGTEDVTATATVTIVDNEMMPTIALSIDPGSIDENGGDQEVTVTGTASGVSSMDISKTIALASGSADLDEDYSVNGDMVITVAAGDLEGGTVLTVTPENDVVYENTETIMVEGGDEGSETPILMLMDDEVMPSVALSLNPESVTENGGHQNVMLAATASGLSKFDIPVSLGFTGTATFGEDMNIAVLGPGGTMIPIFSISPVLNVAAGTLETSLVVVFQPIDDHVYEGSETITVHGQIGDMLASPATLTIIDDEVMPTIKLSLNPDSVTEDGGAQPVVITGTASGLSAMDLDVVVVPLQTSTLTFGADGIIDGDLAFTIPALELEGSTTVTALPIDDSLYETDEYVHLVGRIGDMVSDPVTLTVIDNDAPAIALTASPASIREDGGSQTVSLDVVMSGITVPVDTEISLALSGTASSADYSVAGTQAIVIAAGDSEAGTQLTFAVVADDVYEPSNETIVISASYSGTNIGDATVTVIDDYEPPSVVGAIPDISLEAGDSRQMDVASSFSGRSLVFSAVSSDAGIASAAISGSSLTIEGIRKGASRVTVTAANDASSASFEIGVTVTAIAAEKMVYTDILAAMGRNILSSVSQTIGGRFSVNAAERQMALANRRVDGMASGMEALIGLSGTQATTKYGITDDTLERNRRQPVATRELMRGTSFYYALDDTPTPQGGGEDGLSFTIWGAGDWNAFEGSPSATSSYNGTLVSGYLGLDVSKTASWIAGVAVSRSMGEADYDVTVTDGTLETTLNSVYPYVHWTGPGCCIEIWGVGGFGTGDVEVPDGTSDLSMSMGMLGVRAQLVGAASGGLDLDLIGDAGIAKLSTAESASASLSDLEVSVQRVRIGLEGSRTSDMGNGMLFTPFAQVAGRYDGGDGQSGNGLEVAGGIRIAGGRAGLEARGRLLAIHTGEEVKEHGVSVVAFVRPVGGQGLSMSVAPRLGADTNVSGDMWRDEPLNDVRRSSRSGVGVKAEIGYGLVPPVLSTLLVTPFGQMDMAGEEQRRMRLGARFGSIGDTTTVLSFELAGERIERSAGVPDHRIGLIGRMSF